MRKDKRKRLERAGWTLGDAGDFLELSREEREFVELKLALASLLRRSRQGRRWTQTQVARKLGSSQSRVAKMEAGDPSVSLDLLIRALLALGATKRTVARTIEAARLPRAA